jgi:hypothetical protein
MKEIKYIVLYLVINYGSGSTSHKVTVPTVPVRFHNAASKRSLTKIAGSASGYISQRHGPADPDPYQNVTEPQHFP